jgi:uncharacterized membrane protein HdeD (DUF308 family)
MPIFFLFVGIMLVVVGINNKISEMGALIKEDFRPTNGSPGFHVWIIAIFVAGSLGYIKELKPVANAFLALIIVAMFFKRDTGFFEQFTQAFERK